MHQPQLAVLPHALSPEGHDGAGAGAGGGGGRLDPPELEEDEDVQICQPSPATDPSEVQRMVVPPLRETP